MANVVTQSQADRAIGLICRDETLAIECLSEIGAPPQSDSDVLRWERLGHRVRQAARDWDWTAVESHLNAMYDLLGVSNPATGYAYHTGQHPAQVASLREAVRRGIA